MGQLLVGYVLHLIVTALGVAAIATGWHSLAQLTGVAVFAEAASLGWDLVTVLRYPVPIPRTHSTLP